MPNWCYNHMTVMGNKRDLVRFIKDINAPEINANAYDINKLVPLDPRATITKSFTTTTTSGEVSENTLTTFATVKEDGFDGYLDAIEHWGSKWGACSVEVDNPKPHANIVIVRYETAWSPADLLIEKVSALYPSLIFGVVSDEESRAFVVWSVFHNGEVIEHGSRDPQLLTPELSKLLDKVNENPDDQEALDIWWEAENEWNNYLVEQCDDDMMTCMLEYKKHLAYVRRCDKEGRFARAFISSV